MALTITTPGGVQHIPPQASAGPTLSNTNPAPLGTASPGVDVEVSRADHVHEAPAGGVDTSLQTPSDGGWSQTGTGTATASSGALSLVATGTNTVGMRRTLPASPYLYGVELLVRVAATALPAGGNYSLELGIENSDATRAYRNRLTQGGSVEDRGNTAGSWAFNGSTNTPGLSWSNGTTWLKVVCTNTFIALYWGTGVGTAEPTSWTRNSYVYTPDSTLLRDGLLTRFHVQITRASGTGNLEVTAHPRFRSLLGAPT